jgi:glucosamine-6-phosphate deaminase
MMIRVFNNKIQLGKAAARQAADAIELAISQSGRARIIAATGMSQFEFLNALTNSPGVDWTKVEMFHLDEYVGLPATHPASFRKYLLERLIEPAGITRYHLLDGEADPVEVCKRAGEETGRRRLGRRSGWRAETGYFNDRQTDFESARDHLRSARRAQGRGREELF